MKILLLLFFTYQITFSQTKDYTQYHLQINKAETLFFMENKVDSSLYYYDKVFSEYDFIFVKDLVNAAQIAYFSKKSYQKYIEQGFEQGLKISHLKNYPIFKKVYSSLLKDKKLLAVFNIKRAKYISRIDFKYLDWIYKIAIADQKNKRLKTNKYNELLHKSTDRLIDSVIKKGFPGDKIIGINDSTIFQEINKPYLNLHMQIHKNKDLWYMTSDEQILASHWSIVLFVHNGCSYNLYKTYFLKEMKKGNIHPREIGLLYDNMYRYKGSYPSYCEHISLNGAYKLNMFTEYADLKNKKQTNEMRKLLYIVSTDVDDKKREFEVYHDFKLFSGFWNCR